MKVLVPIARILDPTVRATIADDGRSFVTHARQMVMNPFDEVALTMAVSLRQAGAVGEVIAVGVGGDGYEETLRSALAMQADRAIWVDVESPVTSTTVVDVLAALARRESIDLVLAGKQSADDDACCIPQMLAGRLDYPQAISAVKLDVERDRLTARCDHGRVVADITLSLPAVVGVDLLLCAPRFPTLMQILKAKKQPVERWSLEDLSLVEAPSDAIVERRELALSTRHCVYLDSPAELADLIRRKVK